MLNIILITFICLIPVVFWAYIFSSLNYNKFNKKRFIIGIFAGIISVGPILYMDKIVSFLKGEYLDFFALSSEITSFFSGLSFSLSLILFILFISFVSFVFSFFLIKRFEVIKIFLKNIVIFSFFSFLIGGFFYLLGISSNEISFLNNNLESNLFFQETFFNTVKLVIFYYILIAFIEEISKHFNFLGTSVFEIKKIEDGVLYAIFVALGFSFIENILYLFNIYKESGISGDLIQTYFFRSVFSLMLHVFASSVIAFFFSKAYLNLGDKKFSYFKTISIGIFFAILLHFIFDFSLELGFNFVMILFFIIGYLYISSIFYRE